VLTCIIGFFPEPFVQFAERSAAQLLDPSAYVTAVLGVQGEVIVEEVLPVMEVGQ